MKVAIVGGTGAMGSGLGRLLALKNEVRIGSRDPERAKRAAARIPGASWGSYQGAAEWCEACVVAVPFGAVGDLAVLAGPLAGKLVLSVVNPLKVEEGVLQYALAKGSAAEAIAEALPESVVATAFNNVPQGMLGDPERPELDVLIAAADKEGFARAARLVSSVPRMRPVYVGPLSQAQSVERVTVLEINAARLSGSKPFAVRLVGRDERP